MCGGSNAGQDRAALANFTMAKTRNPTSAATSEIQTFWRKREREMSRLNWVCATRTLRADCCYKDLMIGKLFSY